MEVRQLWLCSGHPSWLSPLWGSFLFSLQPASTAPRSPPSSARSSTAADGRSSSHLFGTQRLARVEGKEKYPPVILIRPKMRHRGRIVIHIYFLLFFPPCRFKGFSARRSENSLASPLFSAIPHTRPSSIDTEQIRGASCGMIHISQ